MRTGYPLSRAGRSRVLQHSKPVKISHACAGTPKRAYTRQPCPGFGDWVDTWWLMTSPHFKPETVMTYRSILNRQLLPTFGEVPLDAIDRTMILNWFEVYSVNTPTAANHALKLLGGILNRAVQSEIIRSNPVRQIRLNPRRRSTRFLDGMERKRLLSALDGLPRRSLTRGLIVKMLLFTGCRSSEIRTLRWDEVGEGVIDLSDGKTGARRVWLGTEAMAVLDEARTIWEAQDPPPVYVFPDPRNPRECIGRCGISDFWRGVRTRIGLGDVRIHDLRHSFATEAVRQGVSLPVVSKLLGHRSIGMTLRYTHASDAEVERAAERMGVHLDNLLGGGTDQS